HLAGRDVGVGRQVTIQEAFVVIDVQILLRADLGDEDLTVLERVHRSRIDVEIRVELLHPHALSARGEQLPEAGGGQALAERSGHTAGDEYVLDYGGLGWLMSHGPLR